VEAQADITMPELAVKLKAARGVKVHPASLSRFLIAPGFSVKKTLLAAEIGRGDVARDCQTWRHNRQSRMRQEPDQLVFLDVATRSPPVTKRTASSLNSNV
jgi:hypothetical protein